MRPPRSIRFRLITLCVGVLTLVFVGFGAYTYIVLHQLLVRSLDQTLARRAEQIATTILDELPAHGEAYVASEIQARYAPELNERAIRIVDERGRDIYASKNAAILKNLALPAAAAPESKPRHWQLAASSGSDYRVAGLVHRLADGRAYWVEVAAPETDIDSALTDLVITFAIAFPVLIGFSILGAYSLLGRALRPVDEIVGAAERITFKDRDQRLPVPATGDEFERISEALNRMIERLDESYQIANRFAGDASHELRTPLTILQGELEAFIGDPSFSREAVDRAGNMLEEVVRLNRIVEGLLLVSRLDAGEAQMRRARVDLAEIVRSVGEQMQLLGEEKRLTLRFDLAGPIEVEGDEIRLRQIVVNLLDNAIKYTPEGGEILLAVARRGALGCVEVSDNGIGISPVALPQVFDRFFRAEEARAGRMQGSGLGLAIVKSIAEAHGGGVRIERREKRGTKVRVEFPLAESPAQKSNGEARLVA